MIDFDKLRKEVEGMLSDESSGRDYSHVMRVFKNAVLIAQSENGVDMDILKAACLLHDIAYSKKFFEIEYTKTSEDIAKKLLSQKDFNSEKIESILNVIRNHNIWVDYKKDVEIETKILRDADRLDYLGYTGIVRGVSYAAFAKKNALKVLQHNLKLEDEFETDKGKELSKPRAKVLKDFITSLEQEY
ncbi:MAG: HD domain-containing protein [Nanoarchaeota archaeon]